MKISDKKNLIFFIFLHKKIDCGYSLEPPRRGGFNEYPQSMFWGRNKKNNVYPCKPQFYRIKVGLKGVKIIYMYVCFRDDSSTSILWKAPFLTKVVSIHLLLWPRFIEIIVFKC